MDLQLKVALGGVAVLLAWVYVEFVNFREYLRTHPLSRVGLRPLTRKRIWKMFSIGMVSEAPDKSAPAPFKARSSFLIPPKRQGLVCTDMGRVEWDAVATQQRCDDGVVASMKCIYNYFRKDNFAAMQDVCAEIPEIAVMFERIATQSESAKASTKAREWFEELMAQYSSMLLRMPTKRMWEMGGLDEQVRQLLERADYIYTARNYADSAVLYDCSLAMMAEQETEEFVELLLKMWTMDYCNMLWDNRFPTAYGLEVAFVVLAEHHFTPPVQDASSAEDYETEQCFYVVLQVMHCVSAFGLSGKLAERGQIPPWLFDYLRKSFEYWIMTALEQKAALEDNKLRDLYVDRDAIGEVLDVLRTQGFDETNDPMVCEGVNFLLDSQLSDGSFPLAWSDHLQRGPEQYDRVNANRAAALALHRRRPNIGHTRAATSAGRGGSDEDQQPLLGGGRDSSDAAAPRPLAYDMRREWQSYVCMLLTRTNISDPTQTELSI